MNYQDSVIKKAYELHQHLMVRGQLTKEENSPLFQLYFDQEVRDLLRDVFLPAAKSKIIHVDEALYFVPEVDNELFSYSNEELRNKMGLKDNKELYMAQFIWMNVLSEFYGEQYKHTNQTRSYVKVDEILRKVNEYIQSFQKKEDQLSDLSTEYDMDLLGLIEAWERLADMTDDIKDISKARTRKYGFILKALRFWVDEGLVVVLEKEEIVLTNKMKNITEGYYHQDDRIHKVKELLEKFEDKGAVPFA